MLLFVLVSSFVMVPLSNVSGIITDPKVSAIDLELKAVSEKQDAFKILKRRGGLSIWTKEGFRIKFLKPKCYEDKSQYCHTYGHLYDWKTSKKLCRMLGHEQHAQEKAN